MSVVFWFFLCHSYLVLVLSDVFSNANARKDKVANGKWQRKLQNQEPNIQLARRAYERRICSVTDLAKVGERRAGREAVGSLPCRRVRGTVGSPSAASAARASSEIPSSPTIIRLSNSNPARLFRGVFEPIIGSAILDKRLEDLPLAATSGTKKSAQEFPGCIVELT